MADFDSSLPIRSEADGADARLHVKIVDGTNPAVNQASVDSDKNVHVEIHGDDATGTDRVIRTSEEGHVAVNGIYDVATNTDPSNMGLVGHVRNATPGDSHQTVRVTGVSNGTVHALDVALHDEDGAAYSLSNPMPVTIVPVPGEGTEIHSFDAGSGDVAAGATANHDYVCSADSLINKVWASASGKIKVEVQINALGAGSFVTKAVAFNSTSNPNIEINFTPVLDVANTDVIRIVLTNLDKQPFAIYTTLLGIQG
jgi:hypothetical protein